MQPHTLAVIRRTAADSLNGAISFPQVVGQLIEVGVGHYHVDFLRSEETVYLRSGESHVEPMPLAEESISPSFVAAGVAAAVRAAQTEGIPYREFAHRAKAAGCIGYFAYLDGRRVVYLGRLGEEHIERFPS